MNIDVNVINNIPGINVAVNKIDDCNITIQITEYKRTPIGSVDPGMTKKIGNHEFIVLEHTEQGTAVIAKDFVKKMRFGSSGDYETSDVRSYCIGDFYDEMVKAVGVGNVVRHTVDLTADDGTGVKKVEDFVSVLTTERYRRYRKFLGAMGESWWTATRATTDAPGYSGYVCYVGSHGILCWNVCGYESGVRPFLIFDSSILVD